MKGLYRDGFLFRYEWYGKKKGERHHSWKRDACPYTLKQDTEIIIEEVYKHLSISGYIPILVVKGGGRVGEMCDSLDIAMERLHKMCKDAGVILEE